MNVLATGISIAVILVAVGVAVVVVIVWRKRMMHLFNCTRNKLFDGWIMNLMTNKTCSITVVKGEFIWLDGNENILINGLVINDYNSIFQSMNKL